MRSFLKTALVAAAAFGALAIGTASQAAVTTYGSLSDWETAIGSWSETTALGAQSSNITSFTTTDGVAVTSSGTIYTVGSGWSSWSGGYTGQVLFNGNTSVDYSLGSSVKGFGMFVEPDPFDIFNITLTTSDGGTITQAVNGSGGAAFFGWTGAGVTSFTLSSTDAFAAGDFFSAAGGGVPEASTWALMLLGFGGVGATLRASRSRQAAATA
jgi:hypothetical protein